MSEAEATIAKLESGGQFKVLRRFSSPSHYCSEPGENLKVAMFLDTETTSLDKSDGKIIEIGYVLAHFNPSTGIIHDLFSRYSGFEDPGFPLSEDIVAITGITDSDLAGQHFDDDRIESDIAKSDIVIAHNAPFDRGFMEIRFPTMASKWWACSQREAPWKAMRTGSSKLEFLAYTLGGVFYGAHRALVDAEVLLHLMTLPAHDGTPIMQHLLSSSRAPSWHVWATNAPFEAKDVLKKNGYKWSDGTQPESPIKAWHKEIGDLEAEKTWLMSEIYTTGGSITVDSISGRERHTNRFKQRDVLSLNAN